MFDYLRLLTEDEILDLEIRAHFEQRNRFLAAELYRRDKQTAALNKRIAEFEAAHQAHIKNWQIQHNL